VWYVAVGYASGWGMLLEPKLCATCCEYLYSLQLLMMGIMVPETCWANRKFNKLLCSSYLVSLRVSSTMHGQTHIKFTIVNSEGVKNLLQSHSKPVAYISALCSYGLELKFSSGWKTGCFFEDLLPQFFKVTPRILAQSRATLWKLPLNNEPRHWKTSSNGK